MSETEELSIPIEERATFFKRSIFLPLIQGLPVNEAVEKLFNLWKKDPVDLDIEVLPSLGEPRPKLLEARLNLLITLLNVATKYPKIAEEIGLDDKFDHMSEEDFQDDDDEVEPEKNLLQTLKKYNINPFVLRFANSNSKEKIAEELSDVSNEGEALSTLLSIILDEIEESNSVADTKIVDKFLLLLNTLKVIPLKENRKPFFPFGIVSGFVGSDQGSQMIMEDDKKFKKQLLEFYRSKKGLWKTVVYKQE